MLITLPEVWTSETGYQDQYQDIPHTSINIETGIKTFRISILILRLVSQL